MSEISNIMSLQSQASPLGSQNEAKSGKPKSGDLPMYEHDDKSIETYLYDGKSSDKKSIVDAIANLGQQTEKTEGKYQIEEESASSPSKAAAGNFLHAEENSQHQGVAAASISESLKAVSAAAAENASGTLTKMRELIMDVLDKPVSDENPETVGSSLKSLTESLKRSMEAIENAGDNGCVHSHPEVAIGGGFVIDLICGTMTFKTSELLEERAKQGSSNAFLDSLKKENNPSGFPSFQDVLADISKVPTEINLEKDLFEDKKEAWAALNEVMDKPSLVASAHDVIDSKKALTLLS